MCCHCYYPLLRVAVVYYFLKIIDVCLVVLVVVIVLAVVVIVLVVVVVVVVVVMVAVLVVFVVVAVVVLSIPTENEPCFSTRMRRQITEQNQESHLYPNLAALLIQGLTPRPMTYYASF